MLWHLSQRIFAWRGPLALLVALVVGGWLRAATIHEVEDLRPRPDALEYEEAARNLVAGHGYSLIVNGATYPPRYPPGLSLLLAPVLAVADRGPGTGVVVVFVTALLTIVASYRLARDAAGPIAGASAALMLAVCPAHVRWSRAVMSDVPSACAVTWLLIGMVGEHRDHARRRWFLLGLGTGLSCLLRMTNIVVAIPGASLALRSRSGGAKALAAFGSGIVLGSLPLLAYDLIRFGSPLRTGYDVWSPGNFFAWQYVLGPPVGGGREPNLMVYGRSLLGMGGDVYSWPLAALIGVGLVWGIVAQGRQRALALSVLTLVGPLLATQLSFFWQGTRFLLPALPALLCVAALPLGVSAPRGLRVTAIALMALGIALLAGQPTLYAREDRFGEPSALAEIDALVPANAALLTRASESMFRRTLRRDGTDRLWVRLAADQHQRVVALRRLTPERPPSEPPYWIQPLVDADSVVARVDSLLDSGRPVYVSTLQASKDKQFPRLMAVLALHFRQQLVVRTRDGVELFQLHRRGAPKPSPQFAPDARAGQ